MQRLVIASLSAAAPGCELEMVIVIIALFASLGWNRRVEIRLEMACLSVSVIDNID